MIDNMVVVTTLPAYKPASHLPIVLRLRRSRDRIYTNFTFEYRHNPDFIDISPRNHLTVYVPFNTATRLHLYVSLGLYALYAEIRTLSLLLLAFVLAAILS